MKHDEGLRGPGCELGTFLDKGLLKPAVLIRIINKVEQHVCWK